LKRGALAPLEIPSAAKTKAELMAWCRATGVPTDVPWAEMTEDHRRRILRGDGDWEGMDGYFESSNPRPTRSTCACSCRATAEYPTCPTVTRAAGRRRPLVARGGKSLPEVSAMSVGDARVFFEGVGPRDEIGPSRGRLTPERAILEEIRLRLEVLDASGLSYLTLDRQAARSRAAKLSASI